MLGELIILDPTLILIFNTTFFHHMNFTVRFLYPIIFITIFSPHFRGDNFLLEPISTHINNYSLFYSFSDGPFFIINFTHSTTRRKFHLSHFTFHAEDTDHFRSHTHSNFQYHIFTTQFLHQDFYTPFLSSQF